MERYIIILLIATMTITVGCSQETEQQEVTRPGLQLKSQTDIISSLLEFDFGPAIAVSERGSLSPFESGHMLRVGEEDKQALRPLHKLDTQGYTTSFTSTATLCVIYYFNNNRMPRHGVDLFPELNTESGYIKFLAMDPGERLARYAAGINRVTGRFYAGFDEDWSPGGFAFAFVPLDERVVVKKYGNRTVTYRPEDDALLTKPLFRYSIYGMQPDTVVFSDMIWPDYSDQP